MPLDPIVFPQQSGGLFQSTPPTALNIQFSPPELFFNWLMNYPAPGDFNSKVIFPDYAATDDYAEFTDWKLNVVMNHFYYYFGESSAVPFCQVEGDYESEGSLGVLADGFYTKDLTFSFANLNLLSEGQYYAKAVTTISAINPATGLRETVSSKTLNIEFLAKAFNVEIPLNVAYDGKSYDIDGELTPLVFNYHLGSAVPSGKDLFYFSSAAFSGIYLVAPTILNISDPIITTTYTGLNSHFSKLLVQFGAGISGLAIGTYDYTIVLGFAGFGSPDKTITVPITLNVLAESTGSFEFIPDELSFEVTSGGIGPITQSFMLISDAAWSVVSEIPSWLLLSSYNGVGSNQITASVIFFADLLPGTYNYNLIVSNGMDTITLPISLLVKPFLTHPFDPAKLYFSMDEDYIEVNSESSGTYVQFEISIKVFKYSNFEPVEYNRSHNLALLNGSGKLHIGSIVHALFEEVQSLEDVVPLTDINFVLPNYLPAEIEITYEEKRYIEPELAPVLPSGQIATFKMIKGFKPFITQNNLCLLSVAQQDTIRITRNSILSCCFVHFGIPRVIVKRNNITIEDLYIFPSPGQSGSQKVLFTYFRYNNDFQVGDLIEVLVVYGTEIRTTRYLVFPDGLESTHVLYENSNGVVEAYELTGRRRTPVSYDFTQKRVSKTLYEFEKKSHTKVAQSMLVNSGKLEANDYKIINEIIKSENVWISLNGKDQWLKVDSITSKIITEDTNIPDDGYEIEFNILENSNDKIYPN